MADPDDPPKPKAERPGLDRRSRYVTRVSSLRAPRQLDTGAGPSREPLPSASMSELAQIFDENGKGKQKILEDYTSSQQAEMGISDLITEPDILAPHSSPEESSGSEQDKDELLRRYTEDREKWNTEAAEKLRAYRETPIDYSPSLHAKTPYISLTISGPSRSVIGANYPLAVTLKHNSNPRLLPVTFHETGSPFDSQAHSFRLYADENGLSQSPISHIAQTPIAAAESPISGPRLCTLGLGESEMRTVELKLSQWDLSAGLKVWVRMPHGTISTWQYGSGTEMLPLSNDLLGSINDGSIVIPVSNALLVEITD